MPLFYIQVKKQQSVFHLPIAQLGERLNGIQRINGSISSVSTTIRLKSLAAHGFFGVFTNKF